MRRSPLARMSAKRRSEAGARAAVRAEVFERDGWRCQIQPLVGDRCFGPLTPHHLKKASQGGAYTAENFTSACAYHNVWVEDHPVRAKELGLVR